MNDNEHLNAKELRILRALLLYYKPLLMLGRLGHGISEVFMFVKWMSENGGKILQWFAFLLIPFLLAEKEYILKILEIIFK